MIYICRYKINNATNLCIYRPKRRCTVTLVLAFFVPMMLVATQSYKPLSAGIKFLMVSVPWFTSTLPAGKGIPTLLQVTVGRGKPSAWQDTWKVVCCTGARCCDGTLVKTGRPEIIIIVKRKCRISYQNNFGLRWHLGKSSLVESKGLQITLYQTGTILILLISLFNLSSVPITIFHWCCIANILRFIFAEELCTTKMRVARGEGRGGTSLWDANGDVPLDGVTFSRLDWL